MSPADTYLRFAASIVYYDVAIGPERLALLRDAADVLAFDEDDERERRLGEAEAALTELHDTRRLDATTVQRLREELAQIEPLRVPVAV
jgi:hypothetical protein